MSRTLEIHFSGLEYTLVMGQIKNVNFDDVKDLSFSDYDELSKIAKYDVAISPADLGWSFLSTDCIVSEIIIKNNNTVESAIEIESSIFDYFQLDYPKMFFWSSKKEKEDDTQLIKLDSELITCCGFYYDKAGCIATLENFEGDFDDKLLTAIVTEPWDWFEDWNHSDEFLHRIYYKEKQLSIDADTQGKGSETFYHDKGWNSEAPILYYREPKINFKELLKDR